MGDTLAFWIAPMVDQQRWHSLAHIQEDVPLACLARTPVDQHSSPVVAPIKETDVGEVLLLLDQDHAVAHWHGNAGDRSTVVHLRVAANVGAVGGRDVGPIAPVGGG